MFGDQEDWGGAVVEVLGFDNTRFVEEEARALAVEAAARAPKRVIESSNGGRDRGVLGHPGLDGKNATDSRGMWFMVILPGSKRARERGKQAGLA